MVEHVEENDGLRPQKGVAMNLTYMGVPTNDYDNGREEKPYQRITSTFILILLGWYLLLGYLTQLVEDGMPAVITEADLSRDNTDTFSEEAAWKYLYGILGEGPRVAGTAYHLNKTVDTKAMVDAIAANANQHVATDWQIASGTFHLKSNSPYTNVYLNASNVVALLEGDSGFHQNGTTGSSVLLNCHYDSVPFAMGASDNAVFCAAMMEILNKFSRRTTKFKHNIIFLFNGAEENGLQASHAFLQHEWSRGVKSVVNLDSAGMNGKPSVFQVTDPRLLHAYRRVAPRPSAQGVGEFLFATGLVPSDTDFRIFRDFGGIHGIDIAFTKWGHVYHTRYDHPSLLLTGVIQNAGNMLMALAAELADMDELDTQIEPSAAVYYDFLNLFVVVYSFAAAYAVDVAVVLVAALSVAYYIWLVGPRWSSVRELFLVAVSRVLAPVAGVLVTYIPVSVMIATTTQLRYLSQPWLVVPLFWIPYFVGAVACSQAYDAWRTKKSGLNRSIRALQAGAATRALLALWLVVLACMPSMQPARYMVAVPLLVMSVGALVSLTVLRYCRLDAGQHLLVEVALSLPSAMFVFTLALRLLSTMLPVMGRSPAGNPDFTVSALCLVFSVLVSNTVSGMELLFSRRRLWLPLGLVYAACLVLMFVPFAPFQDDGPSTQRHYWFHSEITTYDRSNQVTERTTGVTVYKIDVYSAESLGPLLAHYTSTRPQHCDTRVYCDLPLFRTSFAGFLPQATFLHTSGPAAFSPAAALSASRACVGETCTYNFVMIGANHNTITIWPRANVNVTWWSVEADIRPSHELLGRPVYTLVQSLATFQHSSAPYEFSLTCIIPLSLQAASALDVSHHSHQIYHPEEFTAGYRALLDLVPKYFNIASFLSFRNNYEF